MVRRRRSLKEALSISPRALIRSNSSSPRLSSDDEEAKSSSWQAPQVLTTQQQHQQPAEQQQAGEEEPTTSRQGAYQSELEERVADLETKLAVLSRLLQASTAADRVKPRSSSPPPPSLPAAPNLAVTDSPTASWILRRRDRRQSKQTTSRPASSSSDEEEDASRLSPRNTSVHSTVPPLESPAPLDSGRKTWNHAARNNNDMETTSEEDSFAELEEPKDEKPTMPLSTEEEHARAQEIQTDRSGSPNSESDDDHKELNLSFRVLWSDNDTNKTSGDHDGEEEALYAAPSAARRADAQAIDSSKVTWEQQQKAAATTPTTVTTTQQPQKKKTHQHRRRSSVSFVLNHRAAAPPDESVKSKWLDYLNSFQESTPDVDILMEEFIQVPGSVESIMSFGLLICIDAFLTNMTILPIRCVWSILLLLNQFLAMAKSGRVVVAEKDISPPFRFHRQHAYQLIQASLLWAVYSQVLGVISIGRLYHWIRKQELIKLYVAIAMLEVSDRLFCALGQDCLDSMYWNTLNRPRSKRFFISVAVVLVYASIHALLLLVHVATLNVAMNSADQALLTLLISGNFAEVKSTVFKKYNKAALFKVTASDICERFKLGLFVSLVLMLNLSQGMDPSQMLKTLRICAWVWLAEVVADWIKHCFLTKFNVLPARVYHEYALLLAGDVTGMGDQDDGGVHLDHAHAVVKRLGFAQIPLLAVMFRLVREACKYAAQNQLFLVQGKWQWTLAGVAVWSVLFLLKLALGQMLHNSSMAKLVAAPEYSQWTPNKKKKSH